MMKKRRFILFFGIFIITSMVLSCGRNKQKGDLSYASDAVPGGYTPGTDWQYFQVSEGTMNPVIQECDKGCYFYYNHFVYYYDAKNELIMPLCTKNNCLHDKETSLGKRAECNAYLGKALGEVSLVLYQDDLYVGYLYNNQGEIPDGESLIPWVLTRLAVDGSEKDENIITITDEISYRTIHRGYLYYYKIAPGTVDENNRSYGLIATLWRRSLKGNKKEELLYGPEKDVTISAIKAYGDNLYFFMSDGRTGALHCYSCNAESGEVTKTVFKGNLTSFRGKIYSLPVEYTNHDYTSETKDLSKIVYTDTEGNEIETAVADVAQGCFMGSDSKYFYVNNTMLHYFDPAVEMKCQVYDQEFHLVDEFTLQESDLPTVDFVVGGDKFRYRVFEDTETGDWGLAVWDKSVIGSLKGSAIKEKRVTGGNDPSIIVGKDDRDKSSDEAGNSNSDSSEADIVISEITDTCLCEESEWADKETNAPDIYPEGAWEPDKNGEKVYYIHHYMDMTDDCITAATMCTKPSWEVKTELSGYYIKEGKVYERRIAASATYTDAVSEIPVVMELPEDAEKFIGAAASYYSMLWKEGAQEPVMTVSEQKTSIGRISRK